MGKRKSLVRILKDRRVINLEFDKSIIKNFKYSDTPDFGSVQVPIVLKALHSEGKPKGDIVIGPNGDYKISSFNSTLHYGQSIFEGLKAYKMENGKFKIFRLKDAAKRFRRSAQIMGMSALDEEFFIDCVKSYVESCSELELTSKEHSLYLRPLLYANDSIIKVRASSEYQFVIMGSIVGSYFSGGKVGAKVYCNRQFVRAFPHGTGEAKTAANYAISLPALKHATSLGFEQVLYLDALKKENVEELGGMNFFMIKNGTLVTPKLSGTILHGITRDTILELAKHLDIPTEVRDINYKEIVEPSENQSIFACGTAATIVPIIELGFQESLEGQLKRIEYPVDPLAIKLREHLVDCHYNKSPLSDRWLS